MMQRRGREGESLEVARDQGRKLKGRLSLRGTRGLIFWAEVWVSDLCGKPMVFLFLWASAHDRRREIWSLYLGCDYALGLCAHGFWSDG